MDLQSEYCSHMGNILKLGGYQLQVVYLESYLFPSLLLLVGDLRRSGRLKKRVRFTFPTLFAKKTNYLYTRLWNFKKLQRIQIQLAYRYVRLRTNNLEKLSRFPKTSGILRTQHIQSCRAFLVSFEKSKIYIYILPNHLLVEPRYYHSVGSKITLLPRPWQYHADGSKIFFFHF